MAGGATAESLAFHKYEGIGNDFVVVDAESDAEIPRDVAQAICDRRFGIGGDGVLLILPPTSPDASARMRVINADGSIPEMCGNGLRCAVLHVARQRGQTAGEITFDTDAGLRPCIIDDREGQGLVTVDMGIIRLQGSVRIDEGGQSWELFLADAGNPHAITVGATPRETIDRVGPRLSTHARFPAGTNVEFAVFRGGEVDLVVYERGCGVTLACGTGACATVAVGVGQGLVRAGDETTVNLPGGALRIVVGEDGRAIMRGPARHVFSGIFAAPRMTASTS